MSEAAYVAVVWGTSSFRLWLADRTGRILAERRSQEGMMLVERLGGFAAVLQSHLDVIGAPADSPVVVCGMAGARQGWTEAGYLETPASLSSILERAVAVPHAARDIRILPGIAQRHPNRPDVMRGEETQLLGAFGLGETVNAIVCMPGTHSKWVRLRDGKVEGFATFMTGELFSVISRETILSYAVAGANDAEDVEAFRAAVSEACASPALATNLLFHVRSGQLLYGGEASAALARISGTLIGLELAGGLLNAAPGDDVTLIASGRLQALYQSAFDRLSIPIRLIDADEVVFQGLSVAAKAIWPEGDAS